MYYENKRKFGAVPWAAAPRLFGEPAFPSETAAVEKAADDRLMRIGVGGAGRQAAPWTGAPTSRGAAACGARIARSRTTRAALLIAYARPKVAAIIVAMSTVSTIIASATALPNREASNYQVHARYAGRSGRPHPAFFFTGSGYLFTVPLAPNPRQRCYDPGMANEPASPGAIQQAELMRRIDEIRAQSPGEVLTPEEYAERLGMEDQLAVEVIRQALADEPHTEKP